MHPVRVLGSVFPFIFSVLAFSFTIVSFLSRDWAHQNYFPGNLQPPQWKPENISYTTYRSPFVLCTVTESQPTPDTTQYDLQCRRFKAYGSGQTSCQLPSEVDTYSNVTGDPRMCQQIHYSGNLMIASLTFTSIGFALCLVLSFVYVGKALGRGNKNPKAEQEPAEQNATDARTHHHTHHTDRRPRSRYHPVLSVGTYVTIFAMVLAAVCTILAQFFGILGLVQSAPDNGMFASYSFGQAVNQLSGDVSHTPWVQGDGLSIYASLGWLSNGLAAGVVGASWLGLLERY